MLLSTKQKIITVAARPSPLSKKQVEEVYDELIQHYPDVIFEHLWIETASDKDKKTPLRNLEKTNFFTREIDKALLDGKCDVAIHSAKDLPEPIPKGLAVMAVTRGVDARDMLVLREGATPASLPERASIGTSSLRREKAVRLLRDDLTFVPLRGNFDERVHMLEKGLFDGIVAPEAAIIRLGLTHLNRFPLQGERAALQGQLAAIARDDDKNMAEIFAVIDVRGN